MNDLIKILADHIVKDNIVGGLECSCGEEFYVAMDHRGSEEAWGRHVIEKLAETPIQLGYSVQYGEREGHGHVARLSAHLINPENYRKAGPLIGFADMPDEASTSLALAIMSAASMANSKDEKR